MIMKGAVNLLMILVVAVGMIAVLAFTGASLEGIAQLVANIIGSIAATLQATLGSLI